MKYKVGDKVRIVSNRETGHKFEIGEIVILTSVDSDHLPEKCHKLDRSDFWYVDEKEIEPVLPHHPTTAPCTSRRRRW